MNIEFSFATEADAPAISALVNSAYRGDSSRRGWTTEAHLLDGQRTDPQEILTKITSINTYVLVGRQQNEIIGCCELAKQDETKELYFGMFSIKPTSQNSGLGKLFLNYVEHLARDWKLKKIKMTVITLRTELIEYYKRRGYAETPQIIPFPPEDRFGLPKVSGLKMVYLVKEIV